MDDKSPLLKALGGSDSDTPRHDELAFNAPDNSVQTPRQHYGALDEGASKDGSGKLEDSPIVGKEPGRPDPSSQISQLRLHQSQSPSPSSSSLSPISTPPSDRAFSPENNSGQNLDHTFLNQPSGPHKTNSTHPVPVSSNIPLSEIRSHSNDSSHLHKTSPLHSKKGHPQNNYKRKTQKNSEPETHTPGSSARDERSNTSGNDSTFSARPAKGPYSEVSSEDHSDDNGQSPVRKPKQFLHNLKVRFFPSRCQSSVSTGKNKKDAKENSPHSEHQPLNTSPTAMEGNNVHRGDGKKEEAISMPNGDKAGKSEDEKTPFFVYYLACFATIGGLLFGYDTGIVSGSMLLIEDYFDLSTIWKELIVSGTVGAAAVFALFAGFTCDFFGRKITIMIASTVFAGGAIIMGAAQSKEMLLAGRIVVGIGIGFASMSVPVYVSEAAPPAIRGRLVTLNQLFITIGIVISSVVAGGFSTMKETGWRYMLGLAGVPGVIQFIGFLFLPESPRWLMTKGKEEQAIKVLQRIRGKTDVEAEIKDIVDAIEEDKKREGFVLGSVFKTPHVRKALFVGCGLQIFQQLCGINTVIYYSATILKMAGFPPEDAIWLVLVPNSINFFSTFIGVWLVERLGRKKLTVASFIGVVLALAILAIGFQLSANFSPDLDRNVTEIYENGSLISDGCYEKMYSNCETCIEDEDCGYCYTGDGNLGSCLKRDEDDEDLYSLDGRCNKTNKEIFGTKWSHGYCPTDFTWMAVLGLALFVAAFAPGLGPMPWTINSEIYPMWARSTCNSLATGCNWICNLLVSLFFLTLTETITKYGAFWLFAGICFIGMLFTIAFVPETKNKTLEEVEELFKGKKKGGRENLGYERDISSPDLNLKDNTRL